MDPSTSEGARWWGWSSFSLWSCSFKEANAIEPSKKESGLAEAIALLNAEMPFLYELELLDYLVTHATDSEQMQNFVGKCKEFMLQRQQDSYSWKHRQISELMYVATEYSPREALGYLEKIKTSKAGEETELDRFFDQQLKELWDKASVDASQVVSGAMETVADVFLAALCARVLSSTGLLNQGLIPILIKHLASYSFPFCAHAGLFLDHLSKDESKQSLFNAMDIEGDCFIDSYVRASQGLAPETAINRSHRLAYILKGLLIPYPRRGSEACFVDEVVRNTLFDNLPLALSCMEEIAKQGYISRNFQGKSLCFPFIPHIANEHLNTVVFSKEGDKKTILSIENDPQIQNAVLQLGITQKDLAKEYRTALIRIQKQRGEENYKISVEELLEHFAEDCGKEKGWTLEEGERRRLLAKLAFVSCDMPILPQFMKHCFAGMAEGFAFSRTSSAIIGSTSRILQCLLNEQNRETKVKITVIGLLQRLMKVYFRPRYDQCLPSQEETGGQSEGFVLYIPDFHNLANLGMRVDNAEKFSQAVLWILKQAAEAASNTPHIPKELEKEVIKTLEELQRDVETEGFSKLVAQVYPHTELKGKSRRTPWVDCTREASTEELMILLEKETLKNHYKVCPKNERELLEGILGYERKRKKENARAIDQLGSPFSPIFVNGEFFSLFPSWKKFKSGICSDQSVSDWIAKNLEKPGREFGDLKVECVPMEAIASSISSEWIQKEKVEDFWKELNPQIKKPSTLSQYGAVVLKTAQGKLNEGMTKQNLWSFLSKLLYSWEGRSIEDSMLLFAGTKWMIGEKEVKLCFVWDPFEESVALCQVCEDGSNLIKMNPSVWASPETSWHFWSNIIEKKASLELELLGSKV